MGLPPLTYEDASRIWGRRSSLVHGARHGGLNDEDFRLYGRMEVIVQMVLRRGIEDLEFREIFDSANSIAARLPVPDPVPTPVTCPKCRHRFTADGRA